MTPATLKRYKLAVAPAWGDNNVLWPVEDMNYIGSSGKSFKNYIVFTFLNIASNLKLGLTQYILLGNMKLIKLMESGISLNQIFWLG